MLLVLHTLLGPSRRSTWKWIPFFVDLMFVFRRYRLVTNIGTLVYAVLPVCRCLCNSTLSTDSCVATQTWMSPEPRRNELPAETNEIQGSELNQEYFVRSRACAECSQAIAQAPVVYKTADVFWQSAVVTSVHVMEVSFRLIGLRRRTFYVFMYLRFA
jgi:hypothetical protein